MMVREYLVENFGFDDSQLKTVAMGKQVGSGKDSGWGEIQILVFPKGAVMPTEKQPAVGNSSTADGSQSGQEAAATAQKSR
jgi:hypothetical protein